MITVEINGISEQGQSASIKTASRIGFVKTFAGTTPPEGTLLCDGSAVSRDTYSELFAAIGTTWGEGDGSTTFNLPDLRGKWLMGADAERTAGEEVAEGLPNVTGRFCLNNNSGVGQLQAYHTPPFTFNPSFAPFVADYLSASDINNSLQTMDFDLSTANPIYGAQDHVTPASVAVLPCIIYE